MSDKMDGPTNDGTQEYNMEWMNETDDYFDNFVRQPTTQQNNNIERKDGNNAIDMTNGRQHVESKKSTLVNGGTSTLENGDGSGKRPCERELEIGTQARKRKNESSSTNLGDTSGHFKKLHVETAEELLWKDASDIADMLETPQHVNKIYERLLKHKDSQNRVEVVMNELLEETDGVGFNNGESSKDRSTRKSSEGSNDIDEMFLDVQKVIKLVNEIDANMTVNENQVFEMLEANSSRADRVAHAVASVLKRNTVNGSTSTSHDKSADAADDAENHMIEDISLVLKEHPNLDPNEIFSMLEKLSDREDRVEIVLRKLKRTSLLSTDNADSNFKTEDDNEDPLVKDMKTISLMFPEQDNNEIYAYLEAHHNNPNRIQLVTEELLRMQGVNYTQDSLIDLTLESQDSNNAESHVKDTGRGKSSPTVTTVSDILDRDINTLLAIFIDSDPLFLRKELEQMGSTPDRVQLLCAAMFERGYAKLRDRIEKEKVQANRQRFQFLVLDFEEFLQMFPEPEKHFYDEEVTVSESYKNHANIQLSNEFDRISLNIVRSKFLEHRSHYAPTHRSLNELYNKQESNQKHGRKAKLLKTARRHEEMPEIPDEYFYRELWFVRNQQALADHVEQKKMDREKKMALARIRNELQTCSCCYDNEVLFEDMLTCPDGHLFCRDCIRRSVEVAIGDGKSHFNCLYDNCEMEFTTATLQKILSTKTFSLVLKKMQEEELRQADIPDLVSCPFCTFSTIMPDPNDKLFRCQNSECLKESCRLCKEPNHIPMRCEEVEKSAETSMRTFIEARMTEAMIRTCWKCNKRFFKVEGCNKMTCTCGAHMCYVCRQPIKDYSHFGNGKCPQETDVALLHKQEMEKAAKEAKAKYLQEHPEVTEASLKFDPVKNLESVSSVANVRQAHGWNQIPVLYYNGQQFVPHLHQRANFVGLPDQIYYAPQPQHYVHQDQDQDEEITDSDDSNDNDDIDSNDDVDDDDDEDIDGDDDDEGDDDEEDHYQIDHHHHHY